MKIDVAMLDCQVAITENAIARHFAGEKPGPIGARHPAVAPFDAFPTKDRHIIIAIGDEEAFRKLCATLGRNDLADEPAASPPTRSGSQNQQATEGRAQQDARDARPAPSGSTILRDAGLPCGPINTIADVVPNARRSRRAT